MIGFKLPRAGSKVVLPGWSIYTCCARSNFIQKMLMVCLKLGDFLVDQTLPVCILWDHTHLVQIFLPAISQFLLFSNPRGQGAELQTSLCTLNKKVTYPKIPKKGSKKRHGGVSQHSKRALLKWIHYYEAEMICSYRANAFLVDLSQRHANAKQNKYWELLSMLQDVWRLHHLRIYMQLYYVLSSNNLLACLPHHCISSVFSLSLVAAKR